MATTTAFPIRFLYPRTSHHCFTVPKTTVTVRAFRRGDFDRFARKVSSGEAWKDVWRTANDRFELFLFEAKKTAERIDRQYSVAERVSTVVRDVDRKFEIGPRWRTFSMDFSRNLPGYRRQLNDFLNTPLGRTFSTIFFIWFALSGWLFRFFIFATWVLPFAGPLLIGVIANNIAIKGSCPNCQRQFAGYKNQIIRCSNCGNIVWQPDSGGGGRGGGGSSSYSKGERNPRSSKPSPQIIDVDFEEK